MKGNSSIIGNQLEERYQCIRSVYLTFNTKRTNVEAHQSFLIPSYMATGAVKDVSINFPLYYVVVWADQGLIPGQILLNVIGSLSSMVCPVYIFN